MMGIHGARQAYEERNYNQSDELVHTRSDELAHYVQGEETHKCKE